MARAVPRVVKESVFRKAISVHLLQTILFCSVIRLSGNYVLANNPQKKQNLFPYDYVLISQEKPCMYKSL